MAIYVMSDLHLSLSTEKPMDIFGGEWVGYIDKIKENWINLITDEDSVIVPGDVSWGMHLDDAKEDFAFLNSLPGNKYVIRGNHDYWWTSLKKLNEFIEANNFDKIHFIQNDAVVIDDYVICGTRGWKVPGDEGTTEDDEKIFKRELIRLELSLKEAKKTGKEILAMIHYPPFNVKGEETSVVDMLKKYNVKKCYYGHIHGERKKYAKEGEIDGIEFKLVSADKLLFKPLKID